MNEQSPQHNGRAAVIQNLKKLFTAQSLHLMQYLDLLHKEREAVRKSDMEKISAYIDLEKMYGSRINSCNAALASWREKYSAERHEPCQEIERLSMRVQELQEKALEANELNKVLVQNTLKSIKKEIAALPFKAFHVSSPYKKIGTPNFIDITS